MALPSYDIDPVAKAASLASDVEATISLARLARMKGGGGRARKEAKGTGMGVGVRVLDGVVLATSPPLFASSPAGRHRKTLQSLSARL